MKANAVADNCCMGIDQQSLGKLTQRSWTIHIEIYSAARQPMYLGRRNDIKKGKAIRMGELLVAGH